MASIVSQKRLYQWNFFGARHGKNMSDTAGGVFKTILSRYILHTGDLISCLDDFTNLQEKLQKPESPFLKRSVITMGFDEINRKKMLYKKPSKTLKGIKQIHQMTSDHVNNH